MSGFDLFISYASEDRAAVARLVERLRRDGYQVWFDTDDMAPTRGIAANLEAALDACRQTLICISDIYCSKDWTRFELQVNHLKDPASVRKRTIPVKVSALSVSPPTEVKGIPWADLTEPNRYEKEYGRVRASILGGSRPLPVFASPAEIGALRRVADPDLILVRMIGYAKELFAYVHSKELQGPVPQSVSALGAALECG